MELEEFDIEFLSQKMAENPQSPLFARLADLYLVKEQSTEAMKLLEDGIQHFPNYYAGYLILGKAHLAFKEYSRAQKAFTKAIELSPFNQTALKLLSVIPNEPDESTRTTDDNYFTPTESETASSVPEALTVETEQEPTSQPILDEPAAEETKAIQNAGDATAQAVEEPMGQLTEQFPPYNEYLAQHQSKIGTNKPIRLDDYLGNELNEAKASPPEEMSTDEFNNVAVQEPKPEESPLIDQDIPTKPESVAAEEETTISSDQNVSKKAVEMDPVLEPDSTPSEIIDEKDVAKDSKREPTDLDALTEKLQQAEKIVPKENYLPKTPIPEETPDDQAYETDAVSPTLAEIYASQGEFRAAIQAYEILIFSKPEKGADFQKRILELQQKQMEKDGLL